MLKRSEALPKVKEWIEANFEDKKGGCVAKRDIFDAYVAFCRAHNYQTTNDATFGKIFKTIFPHVQVRRLVRRVKAKKWHYCDVAYRHDSPLAIGAGPALSATAVATTDDDDDDCSEDGVLAQRTKAAARCSGSSRGPPKKRKRSTSGGQKKRHLSDDDDEEEKEETEANEKKKTKTMTTKRRRSQLYGEDEEEERDEDDNDEEDGDYVEQQPSSMVQAAEEDEVDGGTPSAGATSIWGDSEDESSSSASSSCHASPSLPSDTTSKPAAEIKHEEDKDLLQSITDTPVPSERAPAPTSLATSTTGLSLCGGGGDIDLSASSVIRVSSMLHSSSAFPLLVGTSAGLPPFGPATKRRLDDSSELGSEAPPSLTSSSAEMFFSYQPASSTALADFVKAEPREEAETETEEKPARRHPPTPMMAASTVDREQIVPHAVAASPPAIAPAYAHTHAHHAHAFPTHYPTHESAAAPAEPSPFEASRNLPIHSQTMTNLLLAHGHTTTSTFSMPTPASYAYAPAATGPQLIHAPSSTASANQASAFLPGQQQHYQHDQHQHHQHHQHQHHSHHQHQHQFSYPPYPIAQHQSPSFVTTASATVHPSWPQPTTGHQTDREMSPESVEIFISHLLTDKSGEVMTLRPQQ